MPGTAQRLVADIGGTHTRLAIFDPGTASLRGLRKFVNRNHASPEMLARHWLDGLGEPPPATGCIAVAAPDPSSGEVRLTNMDWTINRGSFEKALGLRQCRWLNDFEANGFALPWIEPEALQLLQGASSTSGRRRVAVMGPGTGLGGCICTIDGETVSVQSAEPGQAGICPGNALELKLVANLLTQDITSACAEWLVSGPGLQRIDAMLAGGEDALPSAREPERIVELALSGQDERAKQAVETFCGLLGSVCGDFVVSTGTWNGLYLVGGLLNSLLPALPATELLARFSGKGCLTDRLAQTPVWIVTSAYPGLLGAAHAPLEPE